MPNFEVLGTLVRDLHQGLSHLFYIMLPVAILISIVIGYFRFGDLNQSDIIKRAFVAALLLAAFPETSNLILDICDGIALKIDDMSGLETFLKMAQQKVTSFSFAKNVLLLKFDDLIIAALSFISFVLLYFARFLTIALYYFYWTLLSILSPLLILAYVFPGTANITKGLYQGLIEVASWKILWAVMSAMLKSLAFGEAYAAQGDYLTLIVMNFIIAAAMLGTPSIVRSLVGGGVHSTAKALGASAISVAAAIPAKMTSARNLYNHSLRGGQQSNSNSLNNNSQKRRP